MSAKLKFIIAAICIVLIVVFIFSNIIKSNSDNKVNKDLKYDSVLITKDSTNNNSTKVENSVIQGENVNIGHGTQNINK